MKSIDRSLILVAEDDDDDRYLVELAFRSNLPNCGIAFACDGVELVNYLESAESLPAVILLDLNMPRMSGFEVLHYLKQSPVYKDIPVIIFTTSSSEDDSRRAYEMGADLFIIKPTNIRQLSELLLKINNLWLTGCPLTASGTLLPRY